MSDKQFAIPDLTEKAVIVRHTVTGKGYGSSRKDKDLSEQIAKDNGAQDKSVRASKILINPSFTQKLSDVATKSYQRNIVQTLPWNDKGYRILPTTNYWEYMREQGAFREQFRDAVADFSQQYPNAIEEARGRLGRLFKLSDYPEINKLFERHPKTGQFKRFCIGHPEFGIDVQPLPTGDDIRIQIHGEEVSRIQAAIKARLQTTINVAVRDLWARLRDPIENLVERLDRYEVADRKSFQSAWVEHIKDIVELIPRLNLTGDPEIENIAAEARHFLCRWNSDQLKTSKPTRQLVRAAASDILAKMSVYCGTVDDDDDEDDLELEEAA
jgi:hypothetical protein